MDRIDRIILQVLAADARASVSAIAERAGLSQSACTRRIQALEASGRITGYGARLGHKRLGFHVTALVDITLSTHDAGGLSERDIALAKFIDSVA